MIILLFCSLITLFLITLIGDSITSNLLKSDVNVDSIKLFLSGFIFLNTYYSFVSLFCKVSFISNLMIYLSVVIYLYNNRLNIHAKLKNYKFNYKYCILTLSIFLFFCVCATIPPRIYDSGLYHIQSIKWIEEYGIVKGLGNLHGRLAFNSNIFTLFAGTSMKQLWGQSIFCINVLLLSAFIFWQFSSIKKKWNENNSNLLLIYVLIMISSFWGKISDLSSPSPDLFTTIIPIYIFLSYIQSKEENTQQKYYTYCFLIILITYSITVKLACLPLVLFFPFMIYKVRNLIDKKTIAVITLSCIIIITPWCIRNYYLSGYLIYPFPFIDIFNPTWKIPVNDVISEKQLVSSYAWIQKYDTNFYKLNFITKLKVWWRLLSIFRKLIFTIIFITPLVIIATYKKHMHLYIKYMDVYLISWGCFIFWFILAPDFRFGNAYIVFCSVFLLLVVDIRLVTNFIYDFLCKYNNLLTFSFTTILFILSIIILFSFNGFIYPAKIQKNNFDGNVKMSYYMVDSIKVWYPINDDRCFDEELPCTNFKRENLRMLGNQIKDGFKTQSK